MRATSFLWDRGDKEGPQGGLAEHLSQGQSLSTAAGQARSMWGSPRHGHQTHPWGWGRDETILGHWPVDMGQDPNPQGELEPAPP